MQLAICNPAVETASHGRWPTVRLRGRHTMIKLAVRAGGRSAARPEP
ncbi:MAG: hypothetical protein JO316_18085 [Abitibacteriaceae bacterium]|nr:hypothetical protein [Abditibacteriaceae bacterium]